MVAVPQRIANVGRTSIRLDQARQDIDRGEDFERAIDRGPPDCPAIAGANIGHQLFGGEWPSVLEHSIDYSRPGTGEAIPMVHEDRFDLLPGEI